MEQVTEEEWVILSGLDGYLGGGLEMKHVVKQIKTLDEWTFELMLRSGICWYKSTSPSFQVIQYVEVKLVLKFIGLKVIPWSWRPWFLLPRSRTVCCRPPQRPPAGKAVWRRRCSRSRACALRSSRPASMWSSTHVESSPRESSMTQQNHQPRYRVIFFTGTPPKSSKYRKVNLGKVRCI